MALVECHAFGRAGDVVMIEDSSGQRLVLAEDGLAGDPATIPLLSMLPRELHHDQALLVRFHHDLDSQKLRAKPLSVLTQRDVIRLAY